MALGVIPINATDLAAKVQEICGWIGDFYGEDHARWTQGLGARNANGACVSIDAPDAKCFCLFGAMIKFTLPLPRGQKAAIAPALDRHVAITLRRLYPAWGGNYVRWNDAPGRTADEVIALLHEAAIS